MTRNLVAAICSLLFGFLVTGCALDSEFTGKGPLILTAQQEANFEVWKSGEKGGPLYFFIRRDGSSYYVWCTGLTLALCKNSSPRESWNECEARRPGCLLYAQSGLVVWEFDKPASPGK